MSKKSGEGRLTAKQEAFAVHYAKNLSASEAYKHAYPGNKMSPAAVAVEAQKLLGNPKIALRVDELCKRAKEIADSKFDIEITEILYRLKLLGCANLKDYMRIGIDGEPTVDLSATTDDQFYALNEVVIEDIVTGPRQGKRTKVKMPDRIAALSKLYAHKTGNKTIVEHTGKVTQEYRLPDLEGADPIAALRAFEDFRLSTRTTH